MGLLRIDDRGRASLLECSEKGGIASSCFVKRMNASNALRLLEYHQPFSMTEVEEGDV
jgi:hypothetical protein